MTTADEAWQVILDLNPTLAEAMSDRSVPVIARTGMQMYAQGQVELFRKLYDVDTDLDTLVQRLKDHLSWKAPRIPENVFIIRWWVNALGNGGSYRYASRYGHPANRVWSVSGTNLSYTEDDMLDSLIGNREIEFLEVSK